MSKKSNALGGIDSKILPRFLLSLRLIRVLTNNDVVMQNWICYNFDLL